MILDLFIYIIQFYINQNTFLPGFIIRKRELQVPLYKKCYHLKHKNYNQKNTNPFNAFKSKLNRKINQSY